jgi:DNA polymerase elongation subunit (family B)
MHLLVHSNPSICGIDRWKIFQVSPRFTILINRYVQGIIVVHGEYFDRQGLPKDIIVDAEDSELDAINRLTAIVRKRDPDILAGYEVQSSSWGYIIERVRKHFGRSVVLRC